MGQGSLIACAASRTLNSTVGQGIDLQCASRTAAVGLGAHVTRRDRRRQASSSAAGRFRQRTRAVMGTEHRALRALWRCCMQPAGSYIWASRRIDDRHSTPRNYSCQGRSVRPMQLVGDQSDSWSPPRGGFLLLRAGREGREVAALAAEPHGGRPPNRAAFGGRQISAHLITGVQRFNNLACRSTICTDR